jgi:CHAT domain-containing protein
MKDHGRFILSIFEYASKRVHTCDLMCFMKTFCEMPGSNSSSGHAKKSGILTWHYPIRKLAFLQTGIQIYLTSACVIACILLLSARSEGQESLPLFEKQWADMQYAVKNAKEAPPIWASYEALRDSLLVHALHADLQYLIAPLDKLKELNADAAQLRSQYATLGYWLHMKATAINPAMDCYQKAHSLLNQLKDPKDYWYVENPLGALFNIKGDHEEAFYYYDFCKKGLEKLAQASDLPPDAKKSYHEKIERLNNNIAYCHYWNREVDKAIQLLQQTRYSAQANGHFMSLLKSVRYLTEIYTETNQIDSAQVYLSLFDQLIMQLPEGRQQDDRESYFRFKAGIHQANKECDQAEAAYRMALGLSNTTNRFQAKAYNRLAKSLLACGTLDKAREELDRGFMALNGSLYQWIKGTQSAYEENTLSELLQTSAAYYHQKYHTSQQVPFLDTALMCSKLALEVLELLRKELLLENSKILNVREKRQIIEQIIHLHAQLGRHQKINPKHVWPYFLDSKNVLLSDFDQERNRIDELPADKKEVIMMHQKQIRSLTSSLQFAESDSISRDLQHQVLEHRKSIKSLMGTVRPSKPLTHRERGKFVEYLFAEGILYAMDNWLGDLRLTALGTETAILPLLREVSLGIKQKKDTPYFYDQLHQLYLILLHPLGSIPPDLAIYPDGLLYQIPFQALIKRPSSRDYLVYEHTLTIGYGKKSKSSIGLKDGPLVTVAPPYPDIDGIASIERGGLYHLPFASKEVSNATAVWRASTLSLESCNRSQFFELLERDAILHYAGHAIVNEAGSWLALGPHEADWISYQEITRAPVGIRGIVLSACETGLGSFSYGEGINSLAKSFLNAGVQMVVYSLWTINDQTTATLMSNFYHYLSEANAAGRALQKAQLAYLNESEEIYRHPYYWAAFQASAPPASPSVSIWAVGAFIGLCSLSILLFITYKKHGT